ncbi:DNA primase [Streptomyces sp. NBC_00690]|uniref:DNA primase n=1 Tax=Streptomyces sp. NBC_00690 TaxID=2975808 RepID=UPI002E2BA378|nr:DNA primase [Streptomyces sp. NBC_00690]
MNNRVALGLAVGAGYVLGRTKKAKLAFAVGTMVAGRRMSAGPGALGQLITRQLGENPQFKALREQLRQDLGGVGKAATGALVSRQLDGLADRLHERTAGVQDRVKNAIAPSNASGSSDSDDSDDSSSRRSKAKTEAADEHVDDDAEEPSDAGDARTSKEEPEDAERPARRTAKKSATRAQPAKRTAARKPAKAPAKRTAQKAAPKERRNRG